MHSAAIQLEQILLELLTLKKLEEQIAHVFIVARQILLHKVTRSCIVGITRLNVRAEFQPQLTLLMLSLCLMQAAGWS